MLTRILFLFILSVCFGDLYDEVIVKDEEAKNIFLEPRGCKDTDMYNAMRFVGDTYELLSKHLRIRNQTVVDLAKRLHERGTPVLLSECFSTDNLKVTFNWADGDLRYFNYLYHEILSKWNMFEREYVNATLSIWFFKTYYLYLNIQFIEN